MKVPKSFFYFFAFIFFLFALAFMDYFSVTMAKEDGSSRFWFIRSQLALDLTCLLTIVMFFCLKLRGIHIICMLWILIMPFIMYLNGSPFTDIIQTILWPLLFEASYICCQNGMQRCFFLKKEFMVLAFIGAVYFLLTRVNVDHQTNTIYFVTLTMPWLLFKSKKKAEIILLAIFIIFVLLSLKRSMMLSMVLFFSFYFLFGMKSRKSRIYTIVFSIVLIAGVYVAYDKVDEKMGGLLTDRVTKEETDTGIGREAVWAMTINMIQTSPPDKLILGHGHFGVKKNSLLDISAHNDFLEVIYDYGLIIFSLYLCLWGYVIRRSYQLYRLRSQLFLPYAATLSFFITMSIVSHLILYTSYFNYLVMFWGMTEAIIETERKVAAKNKLLS